MKNQSNEEIKKEFEKAFRIAKKMREAELKQTAMRVANNGRISVIVCFN